MSAMTTSLDLSIVLRDNSRSLWIAGKGNQPMRNSFHNIVSSTFDTQMGKWSGIGDDPSIRSLIVGIQPLASWHSCNRLVMPDKSIQTSNPNAEYFQMDNIDFDIVVNFLFWNFKLKACSTSHLPSVQIQNFCSVPAKLGMSKAGLARFPSFSSSSISSPLFSPSIQYSIYHSAIMEPSKSKKPALPPLATNIQPEEHSRRSVFARPNSRDWNIKSERPARVPSLFSDENIAPVVRHSAGLTIAHAKGKSIEELPTMTQKPEARSTYYEEYFSSRGSHNSPRERIIQDSVVIAELTTSAKVSRH